MSDSGQLKEALKSAGMYAGMHLREHKLNSPFSAQCLPLLVTKWKHISMDQSSILQASNPYTFICGVLAKRWNARLITLLNSKGCNPRKGQSQWTVPFKDMYWCISFTKNRLCVRTHTRDHSNTLLLFLIAIFRKHLYRTNIYESTIQLHWQ